MNRITSTAVRFLCFVMLAALLAPAAHAASTATYVGIDSTTKGNWRTVGATPTFTYGSDGFCVIGDSTFDTTFPAAKPTGTMPSYVGGASSSPETSIYPWASSYTPGNPNNLLIGSDFTSSTLSDGQIWWGWTGAVVDWYIDLQFNDENVHQVAFYANELELDTDGRTTQFEVYDNSDNVAGPGTWGSPSPGTLLVDSGSDMTSLFTTPKYAVFNIKGHVQIKVRNMSGSASVVNGIFFDPVLAPPTTITTHQVYYGAYPLANPYTPCATTDLIDGLTPVQTGTIDDQWENSNNSGAWKLNDNVTMPATLNGFGSYISEPHAADEMGHYLVNAHDSSSVTYTLAAASNITKIDVFGGWVGGWPGDGQRWTVSCSTDGTTFTELKIVHFDPATSGDGVVTKVSLTDSTGTLASNVKAIRFTFQDLLGSYGGGTYSEIDVLGMASPTGTVLIVR